MPRLADCHHYAICRRPKITAAPIAIEANMVTIEFSANRGKDGLAPVAKIKIELPEGASLDNTPPNMLRIVDDDGDVVIEGTAAEILALSRMEEVHNPSLPWGLTDLDLEVVYVGQALGPKGDRSAVDRLLAHPTLQTILADTLANASHLDVWVVLMSFEPNAMSFLGPWKGAQGREASIQHFVDIYNTRLPDSQFTNLVEGALISYFQPHYNRTFKSSFPAPTNTSYGNVYVLDYNAVTFELSTRKIFARIGSKAIEPAFEHTGMFLLHDKASRRAFFSWFSNPDVTDTLEPGKTRW